MARSALTSLGPVGLLEADTFLFVNENANPGAPGPDAREDGLAEALAHAPDEAGVGLGTAGEAADGALDSLPEAANGGPFGGLSGGSGITVLSPGLANAKGGSPGKPGGDPSPDPEPDPGSVYTSYHSGAADGTSGYDILIDFKGTWTAALQDAFIKAADYFTDIITTDIGGGGRYRGTTIDDLYVEAKLTAIDGAGGILGQAGPTAVWTSINLTAAGVMEFDTADAEDFAAQGLWDDIVTHELMHVLGFGTLWEYGRDLVDNNSVYTGAAANAAYTGGALLVETDGGSGTAGGHWDDETYDNELMTGYIDDTNYLSKWSVMSLADLGYVVDYKDYPYDDALIT